MKVRIRLDHLYDVTEHGSTRYRLELKEMISMLKRYGIPKSELDVAFKSMNPDDNCIHFGINRTFMFSNQEPETALYGNA